MTGPAPPPKSRLRNINGTLYRTDPVTKDVKVLVAVPDTCHCFVYAAKRGPHTGHLFPAYLQLCPLCIERLGYAYEDEETEPVIGIKCKLR